MRVKPENRNEPSTAEESHQFGDKFPHHVDLVPPLAGFDENVEEEMIAFLEQRVGTFDLYGAIESGDAFVRYCFASAEDAQAFHSRFAAAAERASFHAAS